MAGSLTRRGVRGKARKVTSTFSLGRESADDGSFRRQESQFRRLGVRRCRDGSSRRRRPLSPVRGSGLPVGTPDDDRAGG